jgi:hypothetical protein
MPVSCGWRFRLVLAGCCTLAGVTGCSFSGPVETVSGTITIAGEAPNLKGMEIAFLYVDGRIVKAPVNEDGTYEAGGLRAGEVQVGFIYFPLVQARARGKPRLPMPGKDPSPSGGGPPPLDNPIPGPLRDPSTSKIAFTIESGKPNVFNYDISP